MNLASVLTGVVRRGLNPTTLSSSCGLFAQQTRNTFILKRKYPLRLHQKDRKPQRFRAKNWIYELVEDTNVKPQQPIDVILTSYVHGIGNKGEKVSLPPGQAYNQLLLPGLAVYASPENIEKHRDAMEKALNELPEYSSPWVPRTIRVLSTLLLSVVVSKNNPWTLEKHHVRAAFRKINIHVPDRAITMPKNAIVGPNLDIQNKEFYITVTINGREQVNVRCRLHHYAAKETERIPYCEYWKKPAEAIFPEDQHVLDSMPRHKLCQTDDIVESA